MRKIISILLTMLLILSFAACDQQEPDNSQGGDGSSTTTEPPNSTENPSGIGDNDTSTGDNTSTDSSGGDDTSTRDDTSTDPSDDDKPAEKIKADVFHRDHYYEFIWDETNSSNGVLTISEYMTATAEDMAGMGLSGALTYKEEILTFDVTYTKSADGVYVAEGAVSTAASAVEGESAAAFIQMMKESLGDSQLDVLTGRVLDGEVLTNKEDIENFIWEFDTTVKVTFTVQNGEMVVTEYEKNYTSWGFQAPTKEICHIDNAVVRSFDEYERDVLVRISQYRENGIIEKTDYYSQGAVSSTTHYNENGDMIEDADKNGGT